MNDHEVALFTAFISQPRRRRYLALLADPGRRKKLVGCLPHFNDLDPRYCRQIPADQQTHERILELLRARKAPAVCHVISESGEVDGLDLPLDEALGQVLASGFGTYISCIPGRLAYFEGEWLGERYLLERNT